MRRFWIEEKLIVGVNYQIQDELFHHIVDVCRFGVGDKFELLHDQEAYFVEIIEVTKRSLQVLPREIRKIPPLPQPHLHLALSIPRFTKVDWIVEKCVELGVHSIHLFVSDFSFVRSPDQVPAGKIQRWKKLIQQATQQAGRGDLLELHAATTLQNLVQKVNQNPKTLSLFPYEGECQSSLRAHLQGQSKESFSEIWYFIGSEGGFSHQEVEWLKDQSFRPVSLGAQVLRVETACLALSAILKYEFEVVENGSV